MEILNKTYEDDNRKQSIVDQYRKKILGESCLDHAPPEYWEIGLAAELEIPLDQWRAYPLDIRAQYTARQSLKNMVETVDRHYQEQDDIKERQSKSGKN
ncbi:MAG: hypothetical protein ABI835_02065 [Chloroflexota bacterium]